MLHSRTTYLRIYNIIISQRSQMENAKEKM